MSTGIPANGNIGYNAMAVGTVARLSAAAEGAVTRRRIPVDEVFAEQHRDPAYVEAYDALEEEFTLAEAFSLCARAQACLTQE